MAAVTLAVIGLVLSGVLAWDVHDQKSAAAATKTAATAAKAPVHISVSILNDAQTGKTGWIAFLPSDFTVPANSTVEFTVYNFDGNTAIPAQYASVQGTVGNTITYGSVKTGDPNASPGTQTVSSLAPKDVSHTITIPELHINVPIPGNSITTFTIKTGKAGTYTWHCMDPCGDGNAGWGTAMGVKSGYMEGTFTVQ
jgi:heme/copper-type cytochrome/quinol oxidase subunit 2